jgi:hypothetical protein
MPSQAELSRVAAEERYHDAVAREDITAPPPRIVAIILPAMILPVSIKPCKNTYMAGKGKSSSAQKAKELQRAVYGVPRGRTRPGGTHGRRRPTRGTAKRARIAEDQS